MWHLGFIFGTNKLLDSFFDASPSPHFPRLALLLPTRVHVYVRSPSPPPPPSPSPSLHPCRMQRPCISVTCLHCMQPTQHTPIFIVQLQQQAGNQYCVSIYHNRSYSLLHNRGYTMSRAHESNRIATETQIGAQRYLSLFRHCPAYPRACHHPRLSPSTSIAYVPFQVS